MGLAALRHVESSWSRDRTDVPYIGRQILLPLDQQGSPADAFKKFFKIYFSLIAVAKTSKTMLNSSGEIRHRCLVPDFRGNQFNSVQFSSVAQSCPTLCNPMNRTTPGLPVHHQLPEFIQTHVHRVSDAIQPSHPRSSPSPPVPQSLPPSESFPVSQLFT